MSPVSHPEQSSGNRKRKREEKMKKIAIVTALSVAALTVIAPTQATAAVKCTPTKAVGHEPIKTTPPQQAAKKLPTTLTLVTNCGTIVAKLDPKAPFTVTQMAALVKAKYFDQSLCHRLAVRDFYMLQCGDPTATGRSGPGFTYLDENLPLNAAVTYPAGTLAMANSGPNTNGSQFFLVFKDSGVLGPNYSVWGKITKGLDVLNYIGSLGVTDPSGVGAPKKKVAIIKATVK
jgi:peptidyl-prolyl cis-trans isomerase B (cyclophilin B)